LIVLCDQRSLQVFCLGILLSLLGRILLISVRDGILMQLAIDSGGIILMMGIAGLPAWYKTKSPMHSDTTSEAPTSSEVGRRSIAELARQVI
jgi:hypothetical protein